MCTISRERIERAARIYSTNDAASQALGVHVATFGRLCKRYGIESPCERRYRSKIDEYEYEEDEEYEEKFLQRCTNFS